MPQRKVKAATFRKRKERNDLTQPYNVKMNWMCSKFSDKENLQILFSFMSVHEHTITLLLRFVSCSPPFTQKIKLIIPANCLQQSIAINICKPLNLTSVLNNIRINLLVISN